MQKTGHKNGATMDSFMEQLAEAGRSGGGYKTLYKVCTDMQMGKNLWKWEA